MGASPVSFSTRMRCYFGHSLTRATSRVAGSGKPERIPKVMVGSNPRTLTAPTPHTNLPCMTSDGRHRPPNTKLTICVITHRASTLTIWSGSRISRTSRAGTPDAACVKVLSKLKSSWPRQMPEDSYQHPTREEWREAVRAIRATRAEKRGLEALAAIRALLERLHDPDPENRIRNSDPDVSHGTTSQK